MPDISLKEYVDRRFDDSDKAVQAALVSQEKAIIKAENAAEKRFELLNELRSGVATKEQLEALEKVVDDLKASRDMVQGRGSGFSQSWGILIGAVGLISALLAIFFSR